MITSQSVGFLSNPVLRLLIRVHVRYQTPSLPRQPFLALLVRFGYLSACDKDEIPRQIYFPTHSRAILPTGISFLTILRKPEDYSLDLHSPVTN
jgi:hypothetical protein